MNLKKLSEIHGLTVEEFAGILEVFVDTAKEDIEKIQTAVEEQDLLSAERAAHSLKGASGNLGFEKMFEMARAVEVNAEKGEFEQIKSALPRLTRELEEIITQLSAAV